MASPILIFGGTGQVGRELQKLVPDAVFPDRQVADLTDPGSISATIYELAPRAIINAAAWTAVDAAEDNRDAAFDVNATAPAAMAEAAADLEVPFVHISTDYVFDGAGEDPWEPQDPTGPLGAYGLTKLAGEQQIGDVGGTSAILRTSWVFSAHGQNFVKTMLRLSETRDALSIVGDQVGGPTPASAIAMACLTMADALAADGSKAGIYHFSGDPDTSWAGFAREIFAQTGRNVDVTEIPTSDYPTPAERPLNSRLDCSATEAAFGITRPDWREGLAQVIRDLEPSRDTS